MTFPSPIRAVFIGSSNSQAGTWPEIMGARNSWIVHNFSVGGGGYAGPLVPSRFDQQLIAAIADPSFVNADVDYVIATDASNDVRGGRPVGPQATTLFATARAAFPNARIIVIPVLWNHTTMNIENLDRRLGVCQRTCELREAVLPVGGEVVEWSWLWHWNSTEWDNGVHFTTEGYLRVVQFLEAYLLGRPTDNPQSWQNMTRPVFAPYSAGAASVWTVRTKREGNEVMVSGKFTLYQSFTSYVDIGKFGVGLHPIDYLVLDVIGADRQHYSVQVYTEGSMRSGCPMPAQDYYINASYATL